MAYTDADLQADLKILKNNPQTGLVVRQAIADIAEKLVEVYLTNTEQFFDMKDAVNAILDETFDSASLETMIAEKLAAKEIEYAPKLAEVTAQLAQKADQSFVDSQFSAIVSGAPSGTYTDYNALVAAYPEGNEGVMLVLATGNWYYWNESLSKWTAGGIYLSNSIEDYMTEENESWVI